MRDLNLTKIVERLRVVRAAQGDFLARWAAERLLDRPIFLDGVLRDLGVDRPGPPPNQRPRRT